MRGNKRAYQELANYYDTRALDKNAMIGIAHADNPAGAEQVLALLREKGFTGDNGRTTKRATGIGLYLVARLCSKMGIDVAAASDSGEGFVVTFAFSTNKFQYFE